MAQENNTAREQTALEKLSQDALNQARRERKMIQDTCIAELAQCDTEIPEALEKQVQAEIASLQQAKENLSSAHKIASSTVDELSARAADVAKPDAPSLQIPHSLSCPRVPRMWRSPSTASGTASIRRRTRPLMCRRRKNPSSRAV